MEWWTGFFKPLIAILIVCGIFAVIMFYVGRGIFKMYVRSWRWRIKYKIKKEKYDEDMVRDIINAINNNETAFDLQKRILIKKGDQGDAYEVAWIYNQVYSKLKGGKENG